MIHWAWFLLGMIAAVFLGAAYFLFEFFMEDIGE
jgi:hypothetical protein